MNVPAKGKQRRRFPLKLYAMLEHASVSSFGSTLSWNTDGRSFIIHNSDSLMQHLVPKYFKQTKFRSFTRQLNIWGFKNLHQHEWMHTHFVRGNIEAIRFIERVPIKPKEDKKSSKGNDGGSADEGGSPGTDSTKKYSHETSQPQIMNAQNFQPLEAGFILPDPNPLLRQGESASEVAPSMQPNEDDHLLLISKIIACEEHSIGWCRCSFCLGHTSDMESLSSLNEF